MHHWIYKCTTNATCSFFYVSFLFCRCLDVCFTASTQGIPREMRSLDDVTGKQSTQGIPRDLRSLDDGTGKQSTSN